MQTRIYSPKFAATPQGIFLDGQPLHKCALDALPERTLRHLLRATELHAGMTAKDWEPPVPHGPDDIPPRALFEMHLALAFPGLLEKFNFNPAQLRDAWGRWAAETFDGILPDAAAAELPQIPAPKPFASTKIPAAHEMDVATRGHNNSDQNRFFDLMDARLSRLSDELGLPHEYILGLSAHESGYLEAHNLRLNNPLGLTHAGGPNVRYDSLDSAINYWKKQYGNQVRGATSPADFVQRLQGMKNGVRQPGWNKYNTDDNAWVSKVLGMVACIGRRRAIWQQMRAGDEGNAQ